MAEILLFLILTVANGTVKIFFLTLIVKSDLVE